MSDAQAFSLLWKIIALVFTIFCLLKYRNTLLVKIKYTYSLEDEYSLDSIETSLSSETSSSSIQYY